MTTAAEICVILRRFPMFYRNGAHWIDSGKIDPLCIKAADLIEHQAARIEELEKHLETLLPMAEDGMPRSCGACGTPGAMCDADCANAVSAQRSIRDARKSLAPQAGWVQVPEEATEEMIKAAWNSGYCNRMDWVEVIYRAMLAAATPARPKP